MASYQQVTMSTDKIAREEHAREVAARLRGDDCRALFASTCRECGSADGMEAWDREQMRDFLEGAGWPAVGFYRYKDRDDELYGPCPFCNQGWVVPKGYTELEPSEVREWAGLASAPA